MSGMFLPQLLSRVGSTLDQGCFVGTVLLRSRWLGAVWGVVDRAASRGRIRADRCMRLGTAAGGWGPFGGLLSEQSITSGRFGPLLAPRRVVGGRLGGCCPSSSGAIRTVVGTAAGGWGPPQHCGAGRQERQRRPTDAQGLLSEQFGVRFGPLPRCTWHRNPARVFGWLLTALRPAVRLLTERVRDHSSATAASVLRLVGQGQRLAGCSDCERNFRLGGSLDR